MKRVAKRKKEPKVADMKQAFRSSMLRRFSIKMKVKMYKEDQLKMMLNAIESKKKIGSMSSISREMKKRMTVAYDFKNFCVENRTSLVEEQSFLIYRSLLPESQKYVETTCFSIVNNVSLMGVYIAEVRVMTLKHVLDLYKQQNNLQLA